MILEVCSEWDSKAKAPLPAKRTIKMLEKVALVTLESERRFSVPKDMDVHISLMFCDDEKIHNLNLQFRDKDKATDVLSFPAFEREEEIPSGATIGDIVISCETAKRQAEEYGHSYLREVAFLFAHGLLHVLGYDHEISEEEERLQFGRQDEIMALVGLTVD